MSKATWGDDDGDGVLPWVEDQLDELGAETPVLFDETDGIDFEAVADTAARRHPRRLLRPHAGGVRHALQDRAGRRLPRGRVGHLLRGHDPAQLRRDRPRRRGRPAHRGPRTPRSTPRWPHYPELAESKVLFSYIDPTDLSQVGFYTSHDTRPGFLASLGLPQPGDRRGGVGGDRRVLHLDQRRGGRPLRRRRRVRHLRRGRRRDHRPAAGRPAALADPRDRQRPHRDPRELDARSPRRRTRRRCRSAGASTSTSPCSRARCG